MAKVVQHELKFTKNINNVTLILPIRSEFLSVYCPDYSDKVYLYVRETNETSKVERTLFYFLNDQELPNNLCLTFVGTIHNGFDIHIFENIKPRVGRMT